MQAIIRRAKLLRLCAKFNNKEKNPEAHEILKKIISLALLPPDRVEEALQYVEGLAYELGLRQGTSIKWLKFFKYFRKEWMKVVTPKGFSVFDALDRTNNCIERYHRDLNQFLMTDPAVHKFMGKYMLY